MATTHSVRRPAARCRRCARTRRSIRSPSPGLADLTALVDFAQLKQIALAGDVDCLGPVGQGDWLMALGIAERAACSGQGRSLSQAQALMAALDRLVSPEQMGTLFKVLAYRGPGWPQGAGFGG